MRAACSLASALIGLSLCLCGCGQDPRQRWSYELAVPPAWKAVPASSAPLVPGDVLEAYEVPTSAGPGSLVVFRSPHAPETTAEQLATQTRFLLLNLPSLELQEARTVELGGRAAALIEATAQGDGRSLAPTGTGKPVSPSGAALVATQRVWVRVPREAGPGTLEVQLHAPRAAFDAVRPGWETALASLRAP